MGIQDPHPVVRAIISFVVSLDNDNRQCSRISNQAANDLENALVEIPYLVRIPGNVAGPFIGDKSLTWNGLNLNSSSATSCAHIILYGESYSVVSALLQSRNSRHH